MVAARSPKLLKVWTVFKQSLARHYLAARVYWKESLHAHGLDLSIPIIVGTYLAGRAGVTKQRIRYGHKRRKTQTGGRSL